jgi:hypothetical protein
MVGFSINRISVAPLDSELVACFLDLSGYRLGILEDISIDEEWKTATAIECLLTR